MNAVLIALLTFIPLLTMLVVVHELGHFFTAKWFHIKILEFGIGYPPRAFGFYTGRTRVLLDGNTRFINVARAAELRPGQVVKVSSAEGPEGNLVARVIEVPQRGPRIKGQKSQDAKGPEEYLKHDGKIRAIGNDSMVLADMAYTLNWTPLGGFVRLAGENNPAVPRSLASKSVFARVVVLAAGSLMNALLPIVILAGMFMTPQDVLVGDVVVSEVVPGSPAAVAELRVGDIVLEAGGRRVENQGDLTRAVSLHLGTEMEWTVQRGAVQEVIRVTPRYNPPEGQGPTGVRLGLENSHVVQRSDPPWVALPKAVTGTWDLLVLLKQEVSSWVVGGRSPEFSGPIGIAQVTGEVAREGGLKGWLVLAVLFSVNLAILNILPIPMLDGGRLLFVLIEWVRRGKRIPAEKEGLVHLIGFVVLIAFVLLISVKDIERLIQGRSFLGG
jgi:regulator of sigma E protease